MLSAQRSVVDAVTASAFAALARLRGGRRALHPRGIVAAGVLVIGDVADAGVRAARPDGADLLHRAGRYPARVRFSKSAGLPGPLPDALGIAVRLTGTHPSPGRVADLLFTSSTTAPVLRHLPMVRLGWHGVYGTLLPYRTAAGSVLLALRGPVDAEGGAVPSLDSLRRALAAGPLTFDLLAGPDWHPVGRLEVAGPAEEDDPDLRFDPAHEPPGLVFAPAVRAWRTSAYRASRRASDPGA
jgi:hypothetical protein